MLKCSLKHPSNNILILKNSNFVSYLKEYAWELINGFQSIKVSNIHLRFFERKFDFEAQGLMLRSIFAIIFCHLEIQNLEKYRKIRNLHYFRYRFFISSLGRHPNKITNIIPVFCDTNINTCYWWVLSNFCSHITHGSIISWSKWDVASPEFTILVHSYRE